MLIGMPSRFIKHVMVLAVLATGACAADPERGRSPGSTPSPTPSRTSGPGSPSEAPTSPSDAPTSASEAPTSPSESGAGSPSESPSESPPAGDFDPRGVTVGLEVVGSGFESPLLVTGAGDGSGRLFVVEQGGVVWFVRDGERSDEAFLDISSMVSSGGEQGLLGMAFHPEFPADPRFFVNYTDVEGDTVIAEYAVDPADPDRADPSTARTLLTVDQPFANHNGGATVFGPDGYLYLGLGDGGSAGDPLESGQSLDTLLGKVLRIDVDAGSGGEPYAIPPDNPFVDRRNALPEIWHYGLRNPWRF